MTTWYQKLTYIVLILVASAAFSLGAWVGQTHLLP